MSQDSQGTDKPMAQALLDDSRLMIDFAHKKGIKIPPHLAEMVEEAARNTPPSTEAPRYRRPFIDDQDLKGIVEKVPTARETPPAPRQVETLQHAYNTLLEHMGSVTPRSIRASEGSIIHRWVIVLMLVLGAIGLLGYLTTLAFLTEEALVNSPPLVLHFFFASLLGTTLNGLFTAHDHLKEGTFDPKYNTVYGVRLVLGVIAGVILAGIISPDQLDGDSFRDLAPGIVALLGGFAAEVVRLVLERLVAMLKTLVQGDAEDRVEAEIREVKAEQNRFLASLRLQTFKDVGTVAKREGLDPAMTQRILDALQKTLLDPA